MRHKVYFRADAGAETGYGHFIRTLALADMLKDDFDCTFFTQAPTEYQKREAAGVCRLVGLPSDASKFEVFLGYLRGDETVVLDNYFFTADYQQQIRNKGCRLVCVDDIHDRHYHADIVINQMVTDPSSFSADRHTRLCLGPEWALLRRPFLEPPDITKRETGHWFLSFGGSDVLNLTEKYVSMLKSMNASRISVVVGDAYGYTGRLVRYSDITIHRNLSARMMADLMQRCEYAVVPSSGICLEALSRGCKVASGYYVDNQAEAYRYLDRRRLVAPLGDMREVSGLSDKIPEKWPDSSMKTDFRSIPARYVSLFTTLYSDYSLDSISFVDYTRLPETLHRLLLDARNDSSVRMQMDSTEEIPWESHCRFVNNLRENDSKRYWAVFENGALIGAVNIHHLDDYKVERGIYVMPALLGRSYGRKIEEVTEKYLKSLGIRAIDAKVLHSNSRSLSFHYKIGYRKRGSDDKYEYLTKEI